MTTISIPMLADRHSHPLLYSAFISGVDLSAVREKAVAISKLREAADGHSNASLLVAYGWKDNFFRLEPKDLEPLPPVAVFNLSLHWLVTNSSAKTILREHYGDDVDHVEDTDWYEAHFRVVLNWFAKLGGSAQSLVRFFDFLETLGVWSCEELLLVDGQEIEWFQETDLISRTRFWSDLNVFSGLNDEQRKHVHGSKLFTDGALGARTAAIGTAYLHSDSSGVLLYKDEELIEAYDACQENSPRLAVHAIGDRAIEQTLRCLEQDDRYRNFDELRIEHAQLISLEQARRAKNMGICLSMQPNFNVDSTNYEDRLPSTLCRANNPFRMLIDEIGFVPGDDLIFGSDGMPHGAQEAADQSFQPPLESQRLSIDEFRAGYCSRESRAPEFEISL